jgi:TolB-like protein
VKTAIASDSPLTAKKIQDSGNRLTKRSRKSKPGKHAFALLVAAALGVSVLLLGVFLFYFYREVLPKQRSAEAVPAEKSIAVLPFENISPNKDNAYFADGVQDEILNNLAKIARLKVISRTSVMQYRADAKRDLRQIAAVLGVANVLEGTVRRDGNHVRVSTELVDARDDTTIWADSYDRDLTDIFLIQSEIAQTVAGKLSTKLSLTEKKTIEAKPTDNLEAYDLYLRGKEFLLSAELSAGVALVQESLMDAADCFEKAIRLDPKFTLAYCGGENAQDLIYFWYDPSAERLAKANQAVKTALRLQPDLPEVRLANARHLYYGYRDYDGAREQLALARRGLPNGAEVNYHEALIDRRQGRFEQAIEKLKEAIARDPRNAGYIYQLAVSLCDIRRIQAAEEAYDRLIELQFDEPVLKAEKEYVSFLGNGDDNAVWLAIRGFPPTVADTTAVLTLRLQFTLVDRDWDQADRLIEKMKGTEDNGSFAYVTRRVPVECYSVLMSRFREERPSAAAIYALTREQLNLQVLKSPQDAGLLSQLAVLDALLNNKGTAISEAERAAEMLPVSKDAKDGPPLLMNLAVVYSWTNELDLAFTTLGRLTKMPSGIYYGQLKRDPYWEPLRKDPRFDKLLAELAPRD